MINSEIAILFDLDGVLIDSETEYTRIWEGIEKDYPTGVKDFARIIKGTTLNDILSKYFPNPDLQPVIINRLISEEKAMHYSFCKGAKDLLMGLKDRNVKRAIVTSSDDEKMAHLKADLSEIFPLVNCVIDASMVTRSKPDPQGYLLAAENLGVSPIRCAVFEDSIQGMRAGRASGAYVVGITTTLGREALKGEADILIDSLEDINIDSLLTIITNR